MKTNKRFDPLWHDALAAHAGMVKHANSMRNTVRLFRRSAYRFTKLVIEIRENFHNEFLDFARSSKLNIEEWMEEHFEPIEAMGDSRRDLMANIKSGMTEEQYVAQFTSWGPRKRAAQRVAPVKADTRTPCEDDNRSDAEKLATLKKSFEAVVAENKELRRDNARLLVDNNQLRADFDRLEQLVMRRKRKIG